MTTMNTGIALGVWPEIPIWVVIVAFGVLFVCALKTRELWGRVGVLLILIGGGINTYQRLIFGGVVDNYQMLGVGYNNFADYLIFFGLVVYGYSYFVRRPLRGSN